MSFEETLWLHIWKNYLSNSRFWKEVFSTLDADFRRRTEKSIRTRRCVNNTSREKSICQSRMQHSTGWGGAGPGTVVAMAMAMAMVADHGHGYGHGCGHGHDDYRIWCIFGDAMVRTCKLLRRSLFTQSSILTSFPIAPPESKFLLAFVKIFDGFCNFKIYVRFLIFFPYAATEPKTLPPQLRPQLLQPSTMMVSATAAVTAMAAAAVAYWVWFFDVHRTRWIVYSPKFWIDFFCTAVGLAGWWLGE